MSSNIAEQYRQFLFFLLLSRRLTQRLPGASPARLPGFLEAYGQLLCLRREAFDALTDPDGEAAADGWTLDEKGRILRTVDYPGQPREENGRFAEGKMGAAQYEKPAGKTQTASGSMTLDKEERKRYDEVLLGSKTVDGKEIKSLYGHLYDRAAQRDFSPGEIRDCLKNAASVYPGNREGRMVYQLNDMKVIFQPATGEVITVIRRESL